MNISNNTKIVLLALVSLVLASCQFLWEPASDLVEIGEIDQLIDQGRYQLAIQKCDEMIQQNPKDGLVFMLRAEAYSGLGDYQKSVEDCTKMIQLDPEKWDSIGYHLRSKVYRKWGQQKLAAQDFAGAMKAMIKFRSQFISNPERQGTDFDVLRRQYVVERAAAYACLGQFQKAIEDCDRAENLAPPQQKRALLKNDDGKSGDRFGIEHSLCVNRAFAYLGTKRYKNALDDLNKAISLDPKDGEPYYWRAKVYMKLGRPDDTDMKESEKLSPGMQDQFDLKVNERNFAAIHFEDRVYAFERLKNQ